jgi:hypothetical protein
MSVFQSWGSLSSLPLNAVICPGFLILMPQVRWPGFPVTIEEWQAGKPAPLREGHCRDLLGRGVILLMPGSEKVDRTNRNRFGS